MKSDNERIEEFLKGIVLPEHKSDGHARQLRAQILSGLQARRAGSGAGLWWKTAVLLLGLLGAAAVATEVIIQVRHFYFLDKNKDGSLLFFSTAPKGASGTHRDVYGWSLRAIWTPRVSSKNARTSRKLTP